MVNITLKGGVVREFENGITIGEVAKEIGAGLYKAACGGVIEGKTLDLRTPINADCELSILTFDDAEGKNIFRHTASHILAQAVLRLFPKTKYAIGPAIDDGFYYDFEVEKPFSRDDLDAIEAEMKKIVKEDLPLEMFTADLAKAQEIMADQPYKLELMEKHAANGGLLSFYKQGDFTDLCAGPHLVSTGRIKAFKLLSATGAYWHGDSTKAMLCRVYATAFP
ncbi:MAG: TGS domain-containing protein, partial [Oscillospiraceae bacterium]